MYKYLNSIDFMHAYGYDICMYQVCIQSIWYFIEPTALSPLKRLTWYALVSFRSSPLLSKSYIVYFAITPSSATT